MSIRLIQDLHAGISRRDWGAVEIAANRLRDDVEKTVGILAGTGIGSLPNDYPLPQLASETIMITDESGYTSGFEITSAPQTQMTGLPQDVINLVIAAREFWDGNNDLSHESRALDKALTAFSERVPYENQPDEDENNG